MTVAGQPQTKCATDPTDLTWKALRRGSVSRARVISLSRPVLELITPNEQPATELARYRSAVNIAVQDAIVTLVTPQLRNGPFHIVVTSLPPPQVVPSFSVYRDRDQIHLGGWACWLGPCFEVWEPRVDWAALAVSPIAATYLARQVENLKAQRSAQAQNAFTNDLQAAFDAAAVQLSRAVVASDCSAISATAAALAGLGPGLTPAGDDLLAGMMLALQAGSQPQARAYCGTIFEAAAPRTTRLSGAFLRAAYEGKVDERWHDLLRSLASGDNVLVDQAAAAVAAFGATSGVAMLDGFVLGLEACRASTGVTREQSSANTIE